MRRSRQQIPEDEAIKILKTASNGVLSLTDPDGHPYGVPMSFVYDGEKSVYFHCALNGKKINCINTNPYSCLTIIDMDEVHPEKFTTYFRSVIVEGKISILTDKKDKEDSLRALSGKYSPGIDCQSEIENGIDRVLILRMEIENITGKEAIELTKRRHRQ